MTKIEKGADIILNYLEKNSSGVSIRALLNLLMQQYGYSLKEAEESHRLFAKQHMAPFNGEYD